MLLVEPSVIQDFNPREVIFFAHGFSSALALFQKIQGETWVGLTLKVTKREAITLMRI